MQATQTSWHGSAGTAYLALNGFWLCDSCHPQVVLTLAQVARQSLALALILNSRELWGKGRHDGWNTVIAQPVLVLLMQPHEVV